MRPSREKIAARLEKSGSRMLASRADLRDREIGVKFRAHRARSLMREISFSIRTHSDENFRALVLIAK
jgi:hypothetical protein